MPRPRVTARPPSNTGADTEARHEGVPISDQLRAILGRRDLYALGRAARVDPGVLYRFVGGKRGLTTQTLHRLAGVLGLRLVEGAERK